jgi:hypothetical protein
MAELARARESAGTMLDGHADLRSSSGAGGLRHFVSFDLWRVERQVLDEIEARYGDMVRVDAVFVVDGALEDLPLREPSGGVVTERYPATTFMSALGFFTLRFDDARRCFWFDGGGAGRLLPVWPYGTTGDPDARAVLDFDGNVVARAGDRIEVGGGHVPIPDHITAAHHCGATEAFISTYPQP